MRFFSIITIATLAIILNFEKVNSKESIEVWSDSSAQYTVLNLRKTQKKTLHIVTKRVGKSGVSFSKREVNCGAYKFRYLGGGDTLEEMRASKGDPKLSNLVKGSISEIVSNFACRKFGLR